MVDILNLTLWLVYYSCTSVSQDSQKSIHFTDEIVFTAMVSINSANHVNCITDILQLFFNDSSQCVGIECSCLDRDFLSLGSECENDVNTIFVLIRVLM